MDRDAPEIQRHAQELAVLAIEELLPKPNLLPLIADLFGRESSIFYCLNDVMVGENPPDRAEDLRRMAEWYGTFVDQLIAVSVVGDPVEAPTKSSHTPDS